MKIEEALAMEKESFDRRMVIREKKGHDYATGEDVLSNFKRMSLVTSTLGIDNSKPSGMALYLAMLKIDRLCNLLYRNKTTPSNESVEDTLDDLKNYVDLLSECIYEEYK